MEKQGDVKQRRCSIAAARPITAALASCHCCERNFDYLGPKLILHSDLRRRRPHVGFCPAHLVIIIMIVILSVCLSHSWTVSTRFDLRSWFLHHMVAPSIILVSGDVKFIPKFEGDHPERGRWMRVGWVRIGDFRPISHRISEMAIFASFARCIFRTFTSKAAFIILCYICSPL